MRQLMSPVASLVLRGACVAPSPLLLFTTLVVATTGCAVATGEDEVTGTQEEAQQKPPQPQLTDPLASISAGADDTCVRRASGKVYCWGKSTYGQAGPASVPCVSGYSCVQRPTFVTTAAQVSVGDEHTCVRDQFGQARCWGGNLNGQLGSGALSLLPTAVASAVPVSLNGTPLVFSEISASIDRTCGVTAGSGNVFCWGANVAPGGAPSATPLPLTDFAGIVLDRINSVVTGTASCVAWMANGVAGETACWSAGMAPSLIQAFGSPSATTRMASGLSVTCADKANGTVQCFGGDTAGQLGNGTTSGVATSVAVTVGGGMQLHGVTTGSSHACALDPSGDAFCWGWGVWNQLGQMTTTVSPASSPNPVAVAAFDSAGNRLGFSALAAGDEHTCGIGMDQHIYCWGKNDFGQIGNGTWNIATMPVTQALDPI